jgi:hypothetical protein
LLCVCSICTFVCALVLCVEAEDAKHSADFLGILVNLEAAIVDETAAVELDKFKGMLDQKKVGIIKDLRVSAKRARSKLRTSVLEGIPDLAKMDELMELAKHQTFKWGLAMFMFHKNINDKNDAGQELRKSVKSLWIMHSTDEAFKKYFGDAAEKLVKNIIIIDAATPAKKGQTGESDVSGAASKGSKRSQPKASQPRAKAAKRASSELRANS